jgi:HK97 family phage portal protein
MSGTELILPSGAVVPVRDRRAGHQLEQRDPRAATTALSWRSPNLPQVQDWNADEAFRAGYIANVIAYRCVQLRANAASSTPLMVGRRGRHNENAPLARLLSPPELGGRGAAPRLSARKLMRWTFGQEIVTGRRAWEIDTGDGDTPVAFWPLVSAQLREVPSESGTEWFRVFKYGPQMQEITLQPDDVFYGWDPSGLDFRKAESAIGAARYDLSLVTLCDRYGMAFLKNNAVPAAVITTTQFPDEGSRQTFRRQWAHEFQGASNAGRVHFNEVDEGDGPVADAIDVKVLGLSARDSRLVELRKEAMMEVAIALGTPWSKLDASGRTYENADAEDRDWWENTILPDMLDLVDDINTQLAPRLGDDVAFFDLSSVRALRRKVMPVTQTVGAPALLQARIMQINEARADYGLEPIAGGDRLLTDDEITLFQGGQSDQAVRDALVLLTTRSGQGGEQDPAPAADPPTLPAPTPEPAPTEDRGPDPEAIEARRALVWRSTDAVVTGIESRWVRALRRLFTRQADATIARLTGKRGRQALGYTTEGLPDMTRDAAADQIDPGAVFEIAFWTTATAEVAADLYEQAASAGMERVALSFGISFDLEAPWVRDMIEARANQLAGQVTQTTYDAIVAELVEGVANGESIDDLATRVRGVFAQADELRALRIARTEVISAYNGAAVRGVQELPRDVVIAQEWIATRDGRTRDTHASADGQVVLVGQPFSLGSRSAQHPGDPSLPASETVNCRCTVAFLTPEDYETLDRAPRRIEVRSAHALLGMVPFGDDFDELGLRRVLEGIAA